MQPASAREAARFLSQRGYQHAGELLSGTRRPAEIEVKDLLRDAFASTGTTQRRKDIRLALHMHPEEDGEGYVESFRQFNEWLAKSSEPLQRELHDFRFPLLLHCFIGLASRGEMDTARTFLRGYVPSQPSDSQRATAASLCELQQTAQMQDHAVTRQYLVCRTMVCCSPDAWESLCTFLVNSRLLLLLRILIKFFDVHTIATQPQASKPQPLAPALAPAATVAPAASAAGSSACKYPPPPSRVSAAPPSVCLVTHSSSHADMCCCDLAPSVNAVAYGRADGAIQLGHFSRAGALHSRFGAAPSPLASRSREAHGHSGPVYSCALSYDLQHVLSGSQDGTVRLWSWRHATCLAAYRNHGYPVWHVAFASHHAQFLSSCHDGGLRLFDTQRLTPLRLMAGHLSDVTAARFHPSDAYAVSASHDGTLRLWDISSSGCVRLLLGHTGPVSDVAIAPRAEVAASASDDTTVRLWDLGSSRVTGTLQHGEPVSQVVFSSDGRLLASVGTRRVRIWSWEAAAAASVGSPDAAPLLSCESPVSLLGAAFMADSPLLFACGMGEDPILSVLT